MLIGFLDDTEIVVDSEDPQPDIFVFGGYFIRQDQLHDFQLRMVEIKKSYNLPWYAPVKWNLKDTSLRNYYNPGNLLGPELADQLLAISNPIRNNLLGLLKEFDAKIFISGRYDKNWQEVPRSQYFKWAFENLLQRVGLMAQTLQIQNCPTSSNLLVIDWPQGGVDKSLFDVYMGGFHFGCGLESHQEYYSGPLNQYRFADSIVHSSTLHSGPLQIADLVVGCCRDFLSWAYKGTNLNKIRGLFDLLIGRFYVDQLGRLDGCGFKVAKGNPLDIEAKINEYCDLVRQPSSEEIPF